MIGLKRGTVKLVEHKKEWEIEAFETIEKLKAILGDVICDIQHIGSTAISTIKAKPIIDIVVTVDDFSSVLPYVDRLREKGFYYRPNVEISNQMLFACGSFYEGLGDIQTHFIHVVLNGSMEHINYINFRDYLINNSDVAREYEKIKESLAQKAPIDSGREQYLKGKHDFIVYTLRKALVKSYLGKNVHIVMDRPIGTVHPKHENVIYPINYGYIPGVYGGDGEELDVYLLGVDVPVNEYDARIIGIVHRKNDVEDKLVAAPYGKLYSKDEIEKTISFQEEYYDSYVECI